MEFIDTFEPVEKLVLNPNISFILEVKETEGCWLAVVANVKLLGLEYPVGSVEGIG